MKSRFLTCCSVTAAILLAGVSGQFPAELLHASAAVSGDVNGDGQTNLTDVRQLVSFLARKTTRLENWQNVDFDLTTVRQEDGTWRHKYTNVPPTKEEVEKALAEGTPYPKH